MDMGLTAVVGDGEGGAGVVICGLMKKDDGEDKNETGLQSAGRSKIIFIG